MATQKVNFDEIANSTIIAVIDEYVHNARHRDILKDRLVNGLTYEMLAERYDLSVRHVKNIVYRAEERLFTKFKI